MITGCYLPGCEHHHTMRAIAAGQGHVRLDEHTVENQLRRSHGVAAQDMTFSMHYKVHGIVYSTYKSIMDQCVVADGLITVLKPARIGGQHVMFRYLTRHGHQALEVLNEGAAYNSVTNDFDLDGTCATYFSKYRSHGLVFEHEVNYMNRTVTHVLCRAQMTAWYQQFITRSFAIESHDLLARRSGLSDLLSTARVDAQQYITQRLREGYLFDVEIDAAQSIEDVEVRERLLRDITMFKLRADNRPNIHGRLWYVEGEESSHAA